MICLIGNLPVLQVGHHQVIGYGTEWIDEALIRAARASNRQDFPFIDDIREGVLHYLEHRCPLRVLPLEDLYDRMRAMLRRIGCDAIAGHLTELAPPVTVSLVRAAQEAGTGYELLFFPILVEEIDHLKASGAESIHFSDLEESVKILRNAKSMSKACLQLKSEIVAFLGQFQEESVAPERRFNLTVVL